MMIVNTVRVGAELLTDVGIEHSVVTNKNGEDKEFKDTAWTLQVLKGGLLAVLILILSYPIKMIYDIDYRYIWFVSAAIFANSMHSIAIFTLVRRLETRKRNTFEISSELIGALFSIAICVFAPTVWSVLVAAVVSSLIRTLTSYILPDAMQKLKFNRVYVREIILFGRGIGVSSVLFYLSNNFDKIFLSYKLNLGALGLYSVSRTIADMPSLLGRRLAYQIVFPLVSSLKRGDPKASVDLNVGSARFLLLCAFAIMLSIAIVFADIFFSILYDSRYQGAVPVVRVMFFAAWFAIISYLIEGILMSSGMQKKNIVSQILKLLSMIICIPLMQSKWGIIGAVYAILFSEVLRFIVISVSMRRSEYNYLRSDVLLTLGFVLISASGLYARGILV